jgi:hypothetical protein
MEEIKTGVEKTVFFFFCWAFMWRHFVVLNQRFETNHKIMRRKHPEKPAQKPTGWEA